MSKEKQIEEMVELFLRNTPLSTISCEDLAELMYDSGYRKASKVAREIFEEIEKLLECCFSSCYINAAEEQFDFYRADFGFQISELKKKYTKQSGE